MNTTARRTVTALLAAPALTAALFTGAATASAAPGDPATCSSMAMPQTLATNAAPGMMTRAGQLTMNAPKADSRAAMGEGCNAASH